MFFDVYAEGPWTTSYMTTTPRQLSKVLWACFNILDKTETVVTKITNFTDVVATDIPNYVKTINILDALLQLASPLLDLLGNDP